MLVFNNRRVAVPGLASACFLDDPKYGFTNRRDFGRRTTNWVRSVCMHTRMGAFPQHLINNTKDRKWDELGVKRASKDSRIASWHISIDSDGSFVCHLDLVTDKAYHAGQCNDVSVGIEMYQGADGSITRETIIAAVRILDVITRELGIQRQYALEDNICMRFAAGTKLPGSASRSRQLAYLPGGQSGKDFCGIWGHRNATKNRGKGDPGDFIWQALSNHGYESFVVDSTMDLEVWGVRQRRLGVHHDDCDGVPGPTTRRIIEADNQAHGLWVPRPGDTGMPPAALDMADYLYLFNAP